MALRDFPTLDEELVPTNASWARVFVVVLSHSFCLLLAARHALSRRQVLRTFKLLADAEAGAD